MILGFPEIVDHISRDTLDNTLENLRESDSSLNQLNKKIQKNNTSGVPGVIWKGNRWEARVSYKKERICLGRFIDLENAKHYVAKVRARLLEDPSYWAVVQRFKNIRKRHSFDHMKGNTFQKDYHARQKK